MKCFQRPLLLLAAAATLGFAAEISLDGGSVILSGVALPPQAPKSGWGSMLAVYAGSGDVPPLLGTYSVRSGALVFTPKYKVAAGVRLVAEYIPGRLSVVLSEADTAAARTPTTVVSDFYPRTSKIPENQLKFYLLFSAPMSRGEAWEHIRLRKGDGTQVELPFLELQEELWDPNNQRLTLLFDPGRIKRGVKPLTEVGSALEAGSRYTLEVAAGWRDASGAPLARGFTKTFEVIAADRVSPDPAKWSIAPPRAGSSEPLVIRFGEPLDAAVLQRAIEVDGQRGTVELGADDSEWRFTPAEPWRVGTQRLRVDRWLEDLAGNRIGRLFDVDASKTPPEKGRKDEPFELSFEVKPN